MNELFGFTRDVVKERYALRTPSGFVPSHLPGWTNCVSIIQISPAMGANFCQFQITLGKSGEGRGNSGTTEFFVYVLRGGPSVVLAGKNYKLKTGSYVFIPAQTDFHFKNSQTEAQLLIFQKKFQPLTSEVVGAGEDARAIRVEKPDVIVGHEKTIKGQPFLGNDDARLQVLLPDKPEFDMAVNIFTYQPGATLPFVETHIMEHGLVMLSGQGVYRLDADYYPVQTGDVIWMAPYCPQWFVAMGKNPASYIYYKDVNRAPLA